jgi:hypothetical protein
MKSSPVVPEGSLKSKPTWPITLGCSATSVFLLASTSFYEVTYVMDRTAYLAADVGFGTRVWRGGEFSPHSPGGRNRGIDRQRSSGTPRRLAQSEPS